VTDGQTDGQADGFITASAALCLACCADTLYKLIANFSCSTPVRRPLCSKPTRKFAQTSHAQKLQFTDHIFRRWQL